MAPETLRPSALTVDEDLVGTAIVGRRIEFRTSTQSAHMSPAWLRDNCPCHECRIVATGEHRYFIGEADTLPVAVAATVHDGVAEITWTDGHVSRFDAATLRGLVQWSAPRPRAVHLWENGFTPDHFDHDAVTTDPAARLTMLQNLATWGCVVVNDAPTTSGACAEFVHAIAAPVRETPFDRVHDVSVQPDGYNVAHTAEALLPHTDFASYAWPPSGQVLHMLVNDAAGGDSVVVDGWRVLERLRAHQPDHVATLARVRVPFREHADRAESWALSPIVRTHPDGTIAGIRFSNQLMQPLPPDHPDLDAFYEAYHALARLMIDPDNQVHFRLEAGQMLVVHGHRVLHGRTAFDATGPRHLQDTYFEFDDIWAEAERLEMLGIDEGSAA